MESSFKSIFNKYRTDIFCETQDDKLCDAKTIIKSESDIESYLKNYGNKNSTVHHQRHTIVVERDDNKICLKIFYYEKRRRVGKTFFAKRTSIDFITYRVKDGALFYGSVGNYHSKRGSTKRLRRFVFGQEDILMRKKIIIRDINSLICTEENKFEQITECDSKADPIIQFINLVTNGECQDYEGFYKFILKKQSVKFPNNIMSFIDSGYPIVDKKTRDKFDGKYIDTFMFNRGYKGKKVKRVLHEVKNFNPQVFDSISKLLGCDYILKTLTDEELVEVFQNGGNEFFFLPENSLIINCSKNEKKNILKIILLSIKGFININTVNDHLRFYKTINKFEKCVWRSSNLKEFTDEHLSWSNTFSSYEDGYFNRVYSEKFVKMVETPIGTYDPIILKSSDEYNEESHVQSNCVRTYIKNANSLIVSLRDSSNYKSRATIEYKIIFNGERLELKRSQTLGRFNRYLDKTWDNEIGVLDNRIYGIVKNGLFVDLGIEVNLNDINIKSNYKVNNPTDNFTPIIEWDNDKVDVIGRQGSDTIFIEF